MLNISYFLASSLDSLPVVCMCICLYVYYGGGVIIVLQRRISIRDNGDKNDPALNGLKALQNYPPHPFS